MIRTLGLFLLLVLTSCAHKEPHEGSTYYLGEFDQLNRAPAAAYAAEGFFIQRRMNHRPVRPKHPYFHKVCELDRGTRASRNYSCSSRSWIVDPLGY